MKNLLFVFVLITLFAACKKDKCVEGTGNSISRSFVVDSFGSVSVGEYITANISFADSQSVQVLGLERFINVLTVSVVGGVLHINLPDSCYSNADLVANITLSNGSTAQPGLGDIENTFGFGVLEKVKGIWNGPVTSTTALGSFPEWIVDFRPISENQISAKNELDSLNDIHMSMFIAKYEGEYRVAFRNGGTFAGMTRVAYFLADSVAETQQQSYYRFVEIIQGASRAYTEVIRKQDSLTVRSFTNGSLHMEWKSKLQDTTSCQAAVTRFDFPQKTLTKDFSTAFNGRSESIFYSTVGGDPMGDPYTESDQPYLGQTTVNYSYSGAFTPDPNKKVLLVITTQPLISNFMFNAANLKYRSRYVTLAANDLSYTFNYMHPGSYYLYALYDNNGDTSFGSGDWMSINTVNFTLIDRGSTTTSTQINFTIP